MEKMTEIFFFATLTLHFSLYAKRISVHKKNLLKEFINEWRKHKESLGIFSYYAKTHKLAHISVIRPVRRGGGGGHFLYKKADSSGGGGGRWLSL